MIVINKLTSVIEEMSSERVRKKLNLPENFKRGQLLSDSQKIIWNYKIWLHQDATLQKSWIDMEHAVEHVEMLHDLVCANQRYLSASDDALASFVSLSDYRAKNPAPLFHYDEVQSRSNNAIEAFKDYLSLTNQTCHIHWDVTNIDSKHIKSVLDVLFPLYEKQKYEENIFQYMKGIGAAGIHYTHWLNNHDMENFLNSITYPVVEDIASLKIDPRYAINKAKCTYYNPYLPFQNIYQHLPIVDSSIFQEYEKITDLLIKESENRNTQAIQVYLVSRLLNRLGSDEDFNSRIGNITPEGLIEAYRHGYIQKTDVPALWRKMDAQLWRTYCLADRTDEEIQFIQEILPDNLHMNWETLLSQYQLCNALGNVGVVETMHDDIREKPNLSMRSDTLNVERFHILCNSSIESIVTNIVYVPDAFFDVFIKTLESKHLKKYGDQNIQLFFHAIMEQGWMLDSLQKTIIKYWVHNNDVNVNTKKKVSLFTAIFLDDPDYGDTIRPGVIKNKLDVLYNYVHHYYGDFIKGVPDLMDTFAVDEKTHLTNCYMRDHGVSALTKLLSTSWFDDFDTVNYMGLNISGLSFKEVAPLLTDKTSDLAKRFSMREWSEYPICWDNVPWDSGGAANVFAKENPDMWLMYCLYKTYNLDKYDTDLFETFGKIDKEERFSSGHQEMASFHDLWAAYDKEYPFSDSVKYFKNMLEFYGESKPTWCEIYMALNHDLNLEEMQTPLYLT